VYGYAKTWEAWRIAEGFEPESWFASNSNPPKKATTNQTRLLVR